MRRNFFKLVLTYQNMMKPLCYCCCRVYPRKHFGPSSWAITLVLSTYLCRPFCKTYRPHRVATTKLTNVHQSECFEMKQRIYFVHGIFYSLIYWITFFHISYTTKQCSGAYEYCWTLRCEDNYFPCIVRLACALHAWFISRRQSIAIIVLLCRCSNHSCKFLGCPMCSNSSSRNNFPCCPSCNCNYHIYDQRSNRMRCIYNLRLLFDIYFYSVELSCN